MCQCTQCHCHCHIVINKQHRVLRTVKTTYLLFELAQKCINKIQKMEDQPVELIRECSRSNLMINRRACRDEETNVRRNIVTQK